MKKISLICFFVLILFTAESYSQEKSISGNQYSLNKIYGQIGFNAPDFYGTLTANYEHTIFKTNFAEFTGRTGVGFWIYWMESGLSIPLTGQAVLFKRASHIEIGAGLEYIRGFTEYTLKNDWSSLLNIAYRYEKPNGNFLFKIGIEKNKYCFYPFLSFGYAF
jgi:hypothetical protein